MVFVFLLLGPSARASFHVRYNSIPVVFMLHADHVGTRFCFFFPPLLFPAVSLLPGLFYWSVSRLPGLLGAGWKAAGIGGVGGCFGEHLADGGLVSLHQWPLNSSLNFYDCF